MKPRVRAILADRKNGNRDHFAGAAQKAVAASQRGASKI